MSQKNEVLQVGLSVVLIAFGALLLVNVLTPEAPNFWVATFVILVGVFVVPNSRVAGVSLMSVGIFMLLREFDIIETPWLGYGVSVFLITAGVYGLFMRKKDTKGDATQEPKAPAE